MEFLGIFPFLVFLLMILSLGLRIFYLRKKGISVHSGPASKSIRQRSLFLAFGLLLLLWLAELANLAFSFPGPVLPEFLTEKFIDTYWLVSPGMALIATALVLWITTLFHFGFSLRFGLESKNRGKLVTNGIFSVSRNPFFLSIDLFFAGIFLIHPCIFFLAMAISALAGIHFFILKEEKFLQEQYGEKYTRYRENVRRYV